MGFKGHGPTVSCCMLLGAPEKGGVTLHGSVAVTEYLRLTTLKEKRFSLTLGSGALEVQSTASDEGPMLFRDPCCSWHSRKWALV